MFKPSKSVEFYHGLYEVVDGAGCQDPVSGEFYHQWEHVGGGYFLTFRRDQELLPAWLSLQTPACTDVGCTSQKHNCFAVVYFKLVTPIFISRLSVIR